MNNKKTIFLTTVLLVFAAAISLNAGYFSIINVQKFYAIWKRQKPFVIDIRAPGEFQSQGHIKGSVNIPNYEIPNKMDKLTEYKHKGIYIMCPTGSDSRKVAFYLKRRGFPKIYVVAGGLNDWIKKGYPIIK